MTCHCSHTALCHQYRASTAANDGECLAPQCPCGGYESGESALGIRGNDVSAWDNGPTTTDGPARCANTVIRGALPTGLESTNA